MKLDKELKERIDRYFDEISADELYSVLTEKYHFESKDNDMVIVNNGKYLCREDMMPAFWEGTMSYANLDIKLEIEVVQMDLWGNKSDIQKEEFVCDKSCSIPLAS